MDDVIVRSAATGRTRSPGYPKLAGKSGDAQITDRYAVAAADVDATLPAYGSTFDATGMPGCFARGLTLSEIAVEPLQGAQLWQVTLTYRNDDWEATDETPVEEYELESRDQTYSIRTRQNYLACWDHRLISNSGTAVPAWWATATSTVLDADDYQWIGVDDPVPAGWLEVAANTMVASEYLDGVSVIHYTKRARHKSQLVRDSADDYKIVAPPSAFGVSGSWLRGGSTIRRNGKYWELSVDFTNAQSIDERLYDNAT
ncbi:MAG: hypothetical protein PHI85_04030 [Victivallaceae bacterium]|nr:hypothetical protein [Victivallaceae bacterium]